MANITLYALADEYAQIEDLLMNNGGEVTEELEQMMQDNEQSISAKVDGYNHIIRNAEGLESACDAEIKRLAALKKSAQNAQKSLKNHLAFVMQTYGIEKLQGGTCKVGWRKSKSIEVNEDTLLAPYAKTLEEVQGRLPAWLKVETKVSKTAIKESIAEGIIPAGACEVESRNIVIR